MHIKQIHIDRYGMFNDANFDSLSPELQVFYGVNEAGKTTLMRFIQEILFGFSSRSPGIQEGGTVYGGRLTLNVSGTGIVTVERRGSKGRGIVKLYFDDGRMAGEERLAELFRGLDDTMFRAIFSFGLDGLQGLENIKADELNNYLFHAGMTGNFSIRELEKRLEKKQGALFKPSGRKPHLNKQLAELESEEKKINEWQKKNNGYRQLIEETGMIRRQMESMAQRKSTHRGKIRSLERQKAIAPYIEEQRALQLRLKHLPVYEPFPEDGLSRFENWHTKKVELEDERDELNSKRQASVKKLSRRIESEEKLIRDQKRKKQQHTICYGGLAFATILAVWLILVGQWITGIVTAALIIVFSFYLSKNMSRENSDPSQKELSEMIQDKPSHLSAGREEMKQVKQIFDEQIQSLQKKITYYHNECEWLMKQADTGEEDAYQRKGKAWKESHDILDKLEAVQTKIATLVPTEIERKTIMATILDREIDEDTQILQLENEIQQLEQEEQQLHEKLAERTAQKKELEEGGTYAQLFHRFEQDKDQFRSGARKWAVYRTAEHLLQRAKEQYRNERQPKVVETASRYFAMMTDDRYPVIFAPADEGFIVERVDGIRFSPLQLSRGTVEQLYLAIRLALARIYQSPSPYPLIMDDILVNFDASRAGKAVKTIREMAGHHQVLLFTCHDHMLKHFHDQEILSIKQGQGVSLTM